MWGEVAQRGTPGVPSAAANPSAVVGTSTCVHLCGAGSDGWANRPMGCNGRWANGRWYGAIPRYCRLSDQYADFLKPMLSGVQLEGTTKTDSRASVSQMSTLVGAVVPALVLGMAVLE